MLYWCRSLLEAFAKYHSNLGVLLRRVTTEGPRVLEKHLICLAGFQISGVI